MGEDLSCAVLILALHSHELSSLGIPGAAAATTHQLALCSTVIHPCYAGTGVVASPSGHTQRS